MVTHSRDDALPEQTYRHLLDTADGLDEPFRTECRFVLVAAGRLGLRAGEIAHLDERWMDWDNQTIQVPRHDPCTKGVDGEHCGYCRKRARASVDVGTFPDMEAALSQRWEPKTEMSARAVPFGFSDDIADVVEGFFFHYDGYAHSRVSVNRRVNRVTEAAGLDPAAVYPHALRATAATFWAFKGVPAPALQSLFGWEELGTAQKYIRLTGAQTAAALEDAHDD